MNLIQLISSNPDISFSAGAFCLIVAGIGYTYLCYLNDLDKFRANITTGTRVKVKAPWGVFRGRIAAGVKNDTVYLVIDIDTKNKHFVLTKNIYQP